MFLATASSAQDFEISPALFDFNALPGTVQTRQLVITNHSNTASDFWIKMQDVEYDEEGREIVRPRGAIRNSASEWLTVAPSPIRVEPNSQGVVTVSISVPNGNTETRWCQLSVSEYRERNAFGADANMGAGVVMTPEIIVRVTQAPKDYKDYQAKLSGFQEVDIDVEEDSKKYSKGDRVFSMMVENVGKSIINGQLYIMASNMDNLEEHVILKQPCIVYTRGARKFYFVLKPGTLPKGVYDFVCILDLGPKSSLLGTRLKQNVTIE